MFSQHSYWNQTSFGPSLSYIELTFIVKGTDGAQAAGISVVRVGHEGRPDDATDSETEDDKVPHVTLTVDSYYNEPNSIIKYGKFLLTN